MKFANTQPAAIIEEGRSIYRGWNQGQISSIGAETISSLRIKEIISNKKGIFIPEFFFKFLYSLDKE